jgi:hypothetical protein
VTYIYSGNSPLCFSNSLLMCLTATGAKGLPDVGLIECSTLLAFGSAYLDIPPAGLYLPDSAMNDPDSGVTRAIAALGFDCETTDGGSGPEALSRLRAALEDGPVLVGPLDMGLLPHLTFAARGSDHFVTALEYDDSAGGDLVLHDPHLYPYARIPAAELLPAWQAEAVGYARTTYRMRSRFVRRRDVDTGTLVADTLPHALRYVAAEPSPAHATGSAAVERLRAELARGPNEGVRMHLAMFALPLGARRSIEASRFFAMAGADELAAVYDRRSRLFGRAVYPATRRKWDTLEGVLAELQTVEAEAETIARRALVAG